MFSCRQLRVGWLVEPGFGPVDPEVSATVQAAAGALKYGRRLTAAGAARRALEVPRIVRRVPPLGEKSTGGLESHGLV